MNDHEKNLQRAKLLEGCEGVPPNAHEELEAMKQDLDLLEKLLSEKRNNLKKNTGRTRRPRRKRKFSKLDFAITGRAAFRKRGPF